MWQGPDGTNVPIGVPNNPNTAAVDDELVFLELPLLCIVVPHTSVLMENTAVGGLAQD